jgi:hypothetical protein
MYFHFIEISLGSIRCDVTNHSNITRRRDVRAACSSGTRAMPSNFQTYNINQQYIVSKKLIADCAKQYLKIM